MLLLWVEWHSWERVQQAEKGEGQVLEVVACLWAEEVVVEWEGMFVVELECEGLTLAWVASQKEEAKVGQAWLRLSAESKGPALGDKCPPTHLFLDPSHTDPTSICVQVTCSSSL